jgi:uncharacterized repeat protein (TIGR02543 family)
MSGRSSSTRPLVHIVLAGVVGILLSSCGDPAGTVADCAVVLATSPPSSGTATVSSGAAEGPCGREVTITASASAGYRFDRWSDGVAGSTRSIAVASDIGLTAQFVAQCTVSLVASPALGGMALQTTGTAVGDCGRGVAIEASPSPGYRFTGWSDGSTSQTRSFTLTTSQTLTAQFALNDCTLTLAANPSAGGMATVTSGTLAGACTRAVTIEALANPGYSFSGWSDGSSVTSRTLTLLSDQALTANFTVNNCTLTLAASPAAGGTATVTSGTLAGACTRVVTVQASANPGYDFSGWTNGNSAASQALTLLSDLTLTANFTPQLGVGFGPEQFVSIPAGTFDMGSNAGFESERPVRAVTLTQAFELQRTEVTQAQWRTVMGTSPSRFGGCDRCPVEQVSWDDVQQFLVQLNTQTGLNYRLPTEAEREYAARAGTVGETYGVLDQIAWYITNSGSRTHEVAQKVPNAFGLYDMLGNVWEFVQDWFGDTYYQTGPSVNPAGPATGTSRVLRGGSFASASGVVRAAHRGVSTPSNRSGLTGFRLARTP